MGEESMNETLTTSTASDATGQTALRLSINPTYDSRKTGPRFTVETFVNGRTVCAQHIPNPFIKTFVSVSVWDCLKSILFGGCSVEVRVSGHASIVEDILELDANYIGQGNTRRTEWNASIERALSERSDAP